MCQVSGQRIKQWQVLDPHGRQDDLLGPDLIAGHLERVLAALT
jgi:hypothetical protein